MSVLSLLPIAVNIASQTRLAESRYFALAQMGADIVSSPLFKAVMLLDKIRKLYGEDAAKEMVERMRADVPYDSGRLFNGIQYFEEDGSYTVEASAINPDKNGGEDYAGFVERGTRPGERGRKVAYVADSGYHDLSVDIGNGAVRPTAATSRRSRLQYRGHPGTPAQPYFYQNAIDVLRKRRSDAASEMADLISDMAS
jgi:hypothetical protein